MRSILAGVAAFCLLGFTGCGHGATEERIYHTDAKAQAGPLIYSVSGIEWRETLGDGAEQRIPAHRFVLVRLSVTNSGVADSTIPSTELVDERGNTHPEVSDGRGVPEWFGAIRMVKPAQTEHGAILFDVPAGDYRLRVRHQPEPDQASSALIEIPYRTAPAPAL